MIPPADDPGQELLRFSHALGAFARSCTEVFERMPPEAVRALSELAEAQHRARVQAMRLLLQRHEREARRLRRLLEEMGA